MSSKTKIVVFKMKELIYTAIFVGLGILLIILLIYMFFPGKDVEETVSVNTEATGPASYIPGIYSSSMVLNGQHIDVTVTVDANHINSIEFKNLSDTVTTMFPLIVPALDELAGQICEQQSLDNVTYSDDSKFTSQALLKTIRAALNKAQVPAE